MKRKLKNLIAFIILFLYLAHPRAIYADSIGINFVSPSIVQKIDSFVSAEMANSYYVNVGLVYEGQIVFTKSYGNDGINNEYAYASVSKPVTSMIIMQLVAEGKIKSIDDNIWEYSAKYINCMPEQYKDSPLTIKHLLTHRGGVTHLDSIAPLWKDGKLNLLFQPGTQLSYSTNGYGILGDIIEDVTGKSYNNAVKEYIGTPVGATSFSATDSFIAPGAYVHSNIADLARFSIGVMDNKYVTSDLLYNTILRYYSGSYGLGWNIKNLSTDDITAYHSGSNGLPRAYLLVKPKKRLSVVVLAKRKSSSDSNFSDLSSKLMYILENDDIGPLPPPPEPPPPPPSPEPGKYEGENATAYGNVTFDSDHCTLEPCSGGAFANFTTASSAYLEWNNIDASSSGNYTLTFRYACTAGYGTGNRPLEFRVNGVVVDSSLDFPDTGNFDNWATISTSTFLTGGENSIRLTTIGYEGPNIDYLMVEPEEAEPPPPSPACGDGSVDPGEECDPPGNTTQCSYGSCQSDCSCPEPPPIPPPPSPPPSGGVFNNVFIRNDGVYETESGDESLITWVEDNEIYSIKD